MNARSEWLAARRTGIGGSDAAAIIGLSPWASPLEVYLDKRGELPERQENPSMRWGKLLEDGIRTAYTEETGLKVERLGMVRSPDHPFMLGNYDGMSASGSRVVEIKTARDDSEWGEPGTDQVPTYYVPQAQHYLAISGAQVCDVAVLIRGSDFRIYQVPRDEELIALLIEEERKFWHRVNVGDAPPATTPEEIRMRFRRDDGTSKEATEDVRKVSEQLFIAKQGLEVMRDEVETLTAALQAYMADASTLTYQGRTLATWKTCKSKAIDVKALRASEPVLARNFEIERESRRFLLKGEK